MPYMKVNEKTKSLYISEENGGGFNAQITKIEHIQEKDIDFGDVTRIIYRTITPSTGREGKLVFTKTKNNETIIRWYTGRMQDSRFDGWECYQFKTLFLNTSIVK